MACIGPGRGEPGPVFRHPLRHEERCGPDRDGRGHGLEESQGRGRAGEPRHRNLRAGTVSKVLSQNPGWDHENQVGPGPGKAGDSRALPVLQCPGFSERAQQPRVTIGDKGPLLEAEALEPYSTGMIACFGCPVHCRHRFSVEEGKYKGTRGEGPEYASIGSLGHKARQP